MYNWMLGRKSEQTPLEMLRKEYEILISKASEFSKDDLSKAINYHIEAEKVASKIDLLSKKCAEEF